MQREKTANYFWLLCLLICGCFLRNSYNFENDLNTNSILLLALLTSRHLSFDIKPIRVHVRKVPINDFLVHCVPGSSQEPPPYWKPRRPWVWGWANLNNKSMFVNRYLLYKTYFVSYNLSDIHDPKQWVCMGFGRSSRNVYLCLDHLNQSKRCRPSYSEPSNDHSASFSPGRWLCWQDHRHDSNTLHEHLNSKTDRCEDNAIKVKKDNQGTPLIPDLRRTANCSLTSEVDAVRMFW